jgi:hypothetical protein
MKKGYSSYIIFCMEERTNVIRDFPMMKPTDVTRELAKRWKALSSGEQEWYKNKDKNGGKDEKGDIIILLVFFIFYILVSMLIYFSFLSSSSLPSSSSSPLLLPNPYTGINKNVYPLSLPFTQSTIRPIVLYLSNVSITLRIVELLTYLFLLSYL